MKTNNTGTQEDSVLSGGILIETAFKKPEKPSHYSIDYDIPVKLSSAFSGFINHWLSFSSLKNAVNIAYVSNNVHKIIQETVDEMIERYEIFTGSYLVPTGSMAENTRILKPDEFDFMVVLPLLAEAEIADFICSQNGIEIEVRQAVIDKLFRFKEDNISVDAKLKWPLTNAILLETFRDTVAKHVPPGWRILPESKIHSMRVYLKNQTLTFHLLCDTRGCRELDISVDVCFCVPLSTDMIDNIKVGDTFHAESLCYIRNQQVKMDTQLFAVVSNNPLFCGRFYFLQEQEIFQQKPREANCYRLAKYVAHAFLPKLQKSNCPLCFDTIMPSFYLKMALFYMCDYYRDLQDWGDEQLGNRLIEIFDILRHSLQSVAGHVSYYMVINSSKLDDKAQYNPSDGTLTLGIGMEATKPCTLPDSEEILKSVTTVEVTEKALEYWEYMKTMPWTFGSLLEKTCPAPPAFQRH